MTKQSSVQDCTGQRVYVGLDVSVKSWSVKIIGDSIDRKPFPHDPSPSRLREHLRRNYPGAEFLLGYEAGCTGFWAAQEFAELGMQCLVLHPADVPTTDKEKRSKTDARDCTKIAHALLDKHLDRVHVPAPMTVDDRQLVRARSALVRDQSRVKNRIKSLLAMHGIAGEDVPKTQRWSRAYIEWLKSLAHDRMSLRLALDAYLAQLAAIRTLIAQTTWQISRLAKTDRYARNAELVDSVPGFNVLGSMIFMTEIEDIGHFRDFDRLASLVGLTPSTHSSGATERVGSITTRGRRQLRGLLIEAAWVAQRRDPELNAVFAALCKRMPKNRAIVRIAKKLLARVHHVLRVGEPYRLNNAKLVIEEQSLETVLS